MQHNIHIYKHTHTSRGATKGDVQTARHPPLQYLSNQNQKQNKNNRLPYK